MSGCSDSASPNTDACRRARSIQGNGYKVLVGERGALSVDVDGESYDIKPTYSHPDGGTVGTNELSWSGPGSWQLDVRAGTAPEQIRIEGKSKQYTLTRTVSVEGDRIGISDEIANKTTDAVGIVIRHQV